MPTQTVESFSISFHPTLKEWKQYKQIFLDRILESYNKSKYIIATEHGNQNYPTHYQINITLSKARRADSFRNQFNKYVTHDMEFEHPKIALKIVPITRDVDFQKGYCLKECHNLENVISNLSEETLLEFSKYYTSAKLKKKTKLDRTRLNQRNIHILFETYYKENNPNWIEQEVPRKKVISYLAKMSQEGYYLGSILTSNKVSITIDYIHHHMNNNTEIFIKQKDDEEIERKKIYSQFI